MGASVFIALMDWWFSEFSEIERLLAEKIYQPLGSIGLTEGRLNWSSASKISFLTFAAPYFSKPGLHSLALKFADKLANDMCPKDSAVDRHFAYSSLCKVYYRWRDLDVGNYEKAIIACEASVAMSHELGGYIRISGSKPVRVSHHCFGQLITIEKKRKNFQRAIDLCKKAKSEGWNGMWDYEIISLEKTANRHGNSAST